MSRTDDCAECQGQTTVLNVHVRLHSFAEESAPGGNPGTLVEPKEVNGWKGKFLFNPPTKNFLISVLDFDKNHNWEMIHTYGRVDDEYTSQTEYADRDENGVDNPSWEIDVFDYTSHLGSQGGLGEDRIFHLLYHDDNLTPEDEESGRNFFYLYAPRFSDKRSIITMDVVKEYGRAEENDEDCYEKDLYPDFMVELDKYGFKHSYLDKFYRGMEKICDVNCWVFDFRSLKGFGFADGCWWVDPATGLALQCISRDKSGWTTNIYEMNYEWWDCFGHPDYFIW